MKILEIIPNLHSGGAERFVTDLCNELCRQDGVEVVLATLYDCGEQDIFLRQLSPQVRHVSFGKKRGLDVGLFFRLERFIAREKPSVVHSHIDAVQNLALPMCFHRRNTAYFHTVHNEAQKEASGARAAFRKWVFCRHWCTPVTISAVSQQSFREFYGMDAPLICNGVADYRPVKTDVSASYRRSPATRVLVNVARLASQKNHRMLMRVFSRLVLEGEDAVLLHIGSTADRQLLAELQPYRNDRLFFLGETDNPRDYLAGADFFVLSSLYEGLPISLLEALSVGCVPVSTPVGGCVNVITDGVNGFLSDDCSEEAYYKVLKKTLHLPSEQLAGLRSEAVRSFAPFTMRHCAGQYRALFNQRLAER